MKKKILSVVLALCMVAGLFSGMAKGTEAKEASNVPIIWAGNLQAEFPLGITGEECLETLLGTDYLKPGSVVNPGDPVYMSYFLLDAGDVTKLPTDRCMYTESDFAAAGITFMQEAMKKQGYETFIYFMTHVYGLSSFVDPEVLNSPEFLAEMELVHRSGVIFDTEGKCIPAAPGYTSWKLAFYLPEGTAAMAFYVPYGVENKDYTLVKSGDGNTKWYGPQGQLLWDIAEGEKEINAELTNQSCIPDALMRDWDAKDKDIKVSYRYKGYNVTAVIPADKVIVTGEEWYGAEYFADLYKEFVTVKDWFGQVVPTDVLFSK